MQVANFQSIKSCNWGTKSSVAQMPLIGYFVRDSKRYPRNPIFLRGKPSYPLRWNVAHPTILRKAQTTLVPPAARGRAAPNWTVSPCRANPRTTVTTSTSSSKRRAGSIGCGCLEISEFANERPLLLLGSRSKNAVLRAFLRLNERS
jgi:hypothetical protein